MNILMLIFFATAPLRDTLPADTQVLKEITIRGSRPVYEAKPEGTVVNVRTRGLTGLEVLSRAPGVAIDQHNNILMLNGKSGVILMVNGKRVRMSVFDLLNSIPADNIDKIELLTTPSSKYDAEGSAGVINIILKKNRQASYSVTSGYGKGEKAAANINLSHDKLYGSYSFSHDRTYGSFSGTGNNVIPALGGQIDFDFNSVTKRVSDNHAATIGIDAGNIGGSIEYNASRSSAHSINDGTYTTDSSLILHALVDGDNRWQNISSSFFAKGKHLSLGLDYLYFNNKNPTQVQNFYPAKTDADTGRQFSAFQHGLANTTIQVGVAKLDYSSQLTSNVKLEAGLKGSYTRNNSVSGIEVLEDDHWVSRSGTSNKILMEETILGVYTSLTSHFGDFDVVTGARYEYSHIYDRHLHSLFPNLLLTHTSGWQFSYTRRISRPTYNDLASYVIYNDPFSVFTGNLLLKPAITNNFKLSYKAFSLLYSSDINSIAGSQLAESPDKQLVYIRPENLSSLRSLTFQTSLPVHVNDWWDMNYGVILSVKKFYADYTLLPATKTYGSYSLNFTETFKLPAAVSLELSGMYLSNYYYGTVKVKGYGSVNLGVRKGNFLLSVTDLVKTPHVDSYIGLVAKEAYNNYNHVKGYSETSFFPIIRLTYSQSFGGGMKKERKEGAKDERERVRG
jgi:iron complex outermembrane recepter protein